MLRNRFAVLVAGLVWLAPIVAVADPVADDGHRAVGLLDYVAADYGEAVRKGEVVNEFEYREMHELSEAAAEIAARADNPSLVASVAELREAIAKRAELGEIRGLTQRAKDQVVAAYRIELAPKGAPDFEAGKALYAANCASCHGLDGKADVPIAAQLQPPPVDFTDPERRDMLSPYRAHNTVTFGVEGTSMAGYPQLSDEQRWDVAFYVMALGHGADASPGTAATPTDLSLAQLASLKDVELRGLGLDDDEVARLRTTAPFAMKVKAAATGSSLSVARDHLAAAEAAWNGGDFAAAKDAVLASYLEGFEPVESRLASVAPKDVADIEAHYLDLRAALADGDGARAAALTTQLRTKLDAAEEALSAKKSSFALAVASAFIALREGVEVVLLLALLLGLVGKVAEPRAKRWVHGGWIAAAVAGVGTWWLASTVIEISGASRELLEGVVGLVAAAVLFTVSYWFVGKLQGDGWTRFIKAQVVQRVSSGRLWSLAAVSFLAVYREAFETVLFYQALVLEADGDIAAILAGVGVASVVLAVVAFAIFRLGTKLPLRQFFALSAAGLYALCVILVGGGLHALVEAGVYEPVNIPVPALPLLGVYPDLVSVSAQAALLMAAAVWAYRSRATAPPGGVA